MLEEIMRRTFQEATWNDTSGRFGDSERSRAASRAFDALIVEMEDKNKALEMDDACGRCIAACAEQEYARGFRTGLRLAVEVILGEKSER